MYVKKKKNKVKYISSDALFWFVYIGVVLVYIVVLLGFEKRIIESRIVALPPRSVVRPI